MADGRRQLGFACDENGSLNPPCRTPGCDQPVVRSAEGRTKWFHSPSCQKEFFRRRQALDRVIGVLVRRRADPVHTWRERRDLNSEISRLISLRSAYVGPVDWVRTKLDSDDEAVVAFIDEWQQHRVEVRRPCVVCNGTGHYPALNVPRRHIRRELAQRALDTLDLLTAFDGTLIGEASIREIEAVLVRLLSERAVRAE